MTRVRLGKTNAAIMAGDIDLTKWSDEELQRGRPNSVDGSWRGRAPAWVPKAIFDEMVKRQLSKANELLLQNTYEAVQVLVDLAKNPKVDPGTRLKAVSMILDRTMGKAPERIDLRTNADALPWQEAIVAAVIPLDVAEANEDQP